METLDIARPMTQHTETVMLSGALAIVAGVGLVVVLVVLVSALLEFWRAVRGDRGATVQVYWPWELWRLSGRARFALAVQLLLVTLR